MKFKFPAQSVNPHMAMTKAGYHAHPNGKSYVMRLGRGDYPRFHAYFNQDKQGNMVLSLHLDQSPAVHKWAKHAHHGEYKDERVEEEMERVKRWIAYFSTR